MSDHPSALPRRRSWGMRLTFPRRWPWATALAFGVAFTGALAVAMLQGEKPFYNDSTTYWTAGSTFTVNGHFSLANFDNLTIGYALPLITQGLQVLDRELAWTASSTAKLCDALTVALIGTVLGPALIKTVWPQQPSWGLWRRLALTALLIVFWSGFLNFPLSDFPGLAMALLALIAVARTDSIGWMLLGGAALALAIDVRPAYVLLAPAVIVLVAWTWFDQRGASHASGAHRALCASLLVIGFATVSLPQSLAADGHGGGWSFIPKSSILEPSVYFVGGMDVQATDTYVLEGQAVVAMNYEYPAGRRLAEEQKEGKVTSMSQYLGLFVSHPLVMGGLMIRHVVNGLDPLYSTPYVEHVHNAGRTLGRIAGFLLIFIALLRVLWPAARRMLGPGRLRYLVALALCCATALPTEMERRYLLPLYLLSYAVALTPRWPNPIGAPGAGLRRLRTPAIIAVAFLVFASAVWYVTSDAISHLVLMDNLTGKTIVPQ
jgi:hypothetical protein